MNSLSWFLYAADVVQSFGILLFIFGLLLVPVGIISTIVGYLVPWDHELSIRTVEQSQKTQAAWAWLAPRTLAVSFIFLALSTFIPAKQTMYMIAASEMGEMVVQSDEAKEIFSELKLTVIDQLKQMREITKPSSTNTN